MKRLHLWIQGHRDIVELLTPLSRDPLLTAYLYV